MQQLIESSLFIIGLAVGSFLNVLIDRLPNGENPFKGRSHCDHCKKTLQPLDLIPLVSFALLNGKCRYCKHALSFQYPLVELVTGIIFVVTFAAFFRNPLSTLALVFQFFGLLGFACSLLAIFVADFKYQIIPDEMVVGATVSALIYVVLGRESLIQHLLSGVGASAFFLSLYLLTRGKGMGLGDVKLVLPIGLFLGGVQTFICIYLAFLTGAVVSIILILLKLKHRSDKIAFGPFLVSATLMSIFWGTNLLQWYTHLF